MYRIYQSRAQSVDVSQLQSVSVADADELFNDGDRHAAILLADSTLLPHKADIAALKRDVVVVAADREAEQALGERVDLSMAGLREKGARTQILRAALEVAAARASSLDYRHLLVCARRDLHQLNRIAAGLMQEPDRDALLRRIVEQGKVLTDSDTGCLFLLEKTSAGVERLRPAVYSSDSLAHLPAPGASESLLVDDTSIIGHAATSKRHFTID